MGAMDAPLVVQVRGRWLYVGNDRFPIVDSFESAEGIPLGPIEQTRDRSYGHAEIAGIEDYVLIWITDKYGMQHYMVIGYQDPLFVGRENLDDGFDDYLDLVIEAENKKTWSGITGTGGLGAIVLAELALCGPTAGVGCVSAIVTGIGTLCYGGGSAIFQEFVFYRPNRRNLISKFEGIDVLRP
jgi:hypothetical protein